MKKLAVIGASGFVGSAITHEALSRGFVVTAIVRHPEKMKMHDNLIVLSTDIMDKYALADDLQGIETVVSAYNPGWKNPHIAEDTVNGYQSIIAAVKKAGVKRLLVVGGAATLYVEPGKMLLDTSAIPPEMCPAVEALGDVYMKMLPREKQLDWVFFSPAQNLVRGERTGRYRLGHDTLLVDKKGRSEISVEDYAKAMIDEAENPAHHRERFTIGYTDPDGKTE